MAWCDGGFNKTDLDLEITDSIVTAAVVKSMVMRVDSDCNVVDSGMILL